MRPLPTGTVTFLFTDIEGWTRLLHELGDGCADALAEHRRVLREAFVAHGGVEVDTQGDLTAPVRLYQLGEGEFAPLKTLYGTNLPLQSSPPVGRGRELEEAGALLHEHRLVTLVGPGGSGKTRLALQLAAEQVERCKDGVWWVSLQALRDPELVLPTIAQTVGAKDGIAAHVGDREMLLLLDNLEQLLDAAPVLSELLRATSMLRLLVTSREPLHIAGEQRYAVEPLDEPDAVALFLERARELDPGLGASPAVAAICRRLDGLPLAIELAAARVGVLDSDALLARLERSLPLLTRGARDAPERQRTLRATIEWSHELLTEDERRLFRRLSVFAGSFDVDAAEAICEADLDTLHSLVDKSLVRRWGSGRFGLLETIHEYVRERFEETGEDVDPRGRHATYFLALAERAEPELRDERQAEWLDRLELDRDNFRAALDWLAVAGDAGRGLRLTVALSRLWFVRGYLDEGSARLDAALEHGVAAPAELRVKALTARSQFAYAQGDARTAAALLERGLELNRELEDERGVRRALTNLGVMALGVGDYPRARLLHEESLALCRAAGDVHGIALSSLNLADVALAQGDYGAARKLCEDTLPLQEETGERRGEALCLLNLGLALVLDGRPEDAVAPLPSPVFEELLAEGRSLPAETAVELALVESAVV